MNKSAQFTPGPWSAYNSVNGRIMKHWRIQRDDRQGDIAMVSLDVPADTRATVANLIAAAPAMYEALQQSLVLVELAALEEWGRAVRGEQQPPTTEARDRLEKVKAALAQAEGVDHE